MGIFLSILLTFLALSGFFTIFFLRRRKAKADKVGQLTGALSGKEIQPEILIESISDGIIVVDTKCIVNLINKAAADMSTWLVQEALGFDARVILRLVKDSKTNEMIPDSEHPFTQVLQKRERFSKTLELIDRKSKKIFISLVISPVIIPKKNELIGAIAVFRDVSTEKNEEQRRAEFISTASHEMRTPVAAIEGYLALAMNDKVSKIDNSARQYLDKAHLSTQHLGKLFQDLLTSAKAEDGRLTSHPEVVDMGEFVTQLAEDLRFSAEKKSLEVEFVINSKPQTDSTDVIDTTRPDTNMKSIQPLYYCHIDPDRIREVITNVFDNAVKYTNEGKISLGLTGNTQVVQIKISDTGPGIPKEDLPHLFQKFYRVDNSATRSVGGTGLGLFICRKIVELYNGTIWAESKIGEGSNFYINLPRLSSIKTQQLKAQTASSEPAGTKAQT